MVRALGPKTTSKASPIAANDIDEPIDITAPIALFMNAAEAQIRAKVQLVAHDELSFGTLSTGERIAVALVLDRYDLLQNAWGSILEAVHRLGPEWTQAALRIQRHGWLDEL